MLPLAIGLCAAAALLPLVATLRRGAVPAGLLAVAAIGFALAAAQQQREPEEPPANRPLAVPGDGYIGSGSCRACHPGEHQSWHDSYHRTMTQPATRATVKASFESLQLDSFGEPVRLQWRGETLWADLLERSPAAQRVERPVVQLTGSHHAQAFWYATGNERELGLLPLVYRVEERRWLPFAAVFLVPPHVREPPVPGTWNKNCNGCHATHSQPRVDIGRTDTRAAELGIACEACHGPGEAHAAANRNPLRRYARHLGGGGDDTIVNPARLPADRSSEVCGQCHSVSIVRKAHFDSWRESGSPFRPGQVLAESQLVVDPSQRDAVELRAQLASDPDFFAGKFWPDGLARVTGRELHGLLRSPCYGDGQGERAMRCTSCHVLHQTSDDGRARAAWADDQLAPGMDGDAACVQCHPQFREQRALLAHTHHGAGSAGSRCLDCHMPHTSYGLLKAVRSHTVDSPSVAVELATGRPNACNLCHLDRTLQWTGGWLQQWYGHAATVLDDDQRTIAAGPRWLLSGDAGQRALAAWHAGRAPAQQAAGTDWLPPYLAQLLADPYYAVRIVARRSLGSLPGAAVPADYDELAEDGAARAAVAALHERWRTGAALPARPEVLLDAGGLRWETFARLLARRDDRPMFLAE